MKGFHRIFNGPNITASLPHQAFTGKLVPQDPNDEPASVLLERIKAERAKESKGKTGTRKQRLIDRSEHPY